jgi:hypothetical protein
MKKKQAKLVLDKKTVSKLNSTDTQQIQGGVACTWDGCMPGEETIAITKVLTVVLTAI